MQPERFETQLLQIIGDNPSFDIEIFLDRIYEGPDWSKLIVAHIYLDHIFTEILTRSFQHPKYYLKDYKAFPDKLKLCQAFGLFTDDLGPVLAAINSKRNKFAHALAFEVSPNEKRELFDMISGFRLADGVTDNRKLDDFLCCVVLLTEAERSANSKLKAIAQQRAATVEAMLEFLKNHYRSARPES